MVTETTVDGVGLIQPRVERVRATTESTAVVTPTAAEQEQEDKPPPVTAKAAEAAAVVLTARRRYEHRCTDAVAFFTKCHNSFLSFVFILTLRALSV